jgi:mono/diheme cytochrome c family protein
MNRFTNPIVPAGIALAALIMITGCESGAQPGDGPFLQAGSPEEAGRYLAIMGGCNDCHTAGYLETEGSVPEEQWLAGTTLGWNGPWGTTYPPNLRLTVQQMSEDQWVQLLRTRNERPPMPWMNVRQASERDLRALYSYIKSLGPTGEPAPAYLPPGQEPEAPYFTIVAPPAGN